jgi:tetratricopeptide (TPR) repeat protein
MIALDRGAWSRAGAAAIKLSEALHAIPMGHWDPLPSLIRGRALLGAGAHEEAAVSLEDALGRARRVDANGASALAATTLAQARAFLGERLDRPEGEADAEVAAVRDETAGIVAMGRGDRAGAIQAFDEAIERWTALGSTVWLARALAMRADALQATGDRARAAASRGRSRAVLEQIGMPARDRASLEHPLAGLL